MKKAQIINKELTVMYELSYEERMEMRTERTANSSVNLKKELEATFPGTEFSLTSDLCTIYVTYMDGPSRAKVNLHCNRYRYIDRVEDSWKEKGPDSSNSYCSVTRNSSEVDLDQ